MLFKHCILLYLIISFLLIDADAAKRRRGRSRKKLKITVLYESLCPDSVAFITYQLAPVWKDFSRYINVSFVPFGHAHSVGYGQDFRCQHGPDECAGNRMQSCVLYLLENQPDKQMRFVACQMDGSYNINGNQCIKRIGVDEKEVKQCVRSGTGTYLQLRDEYITKTYEPSFIPTIVYNEKFDENLQNQSLENFKAVVCTLLKKRHGSCARARRYLRYY